ncbi:MAG: glycosyltransferase [Candidatus Moranbacteria bacterium]|nr:glycosyltransferase [Candidatus Moranbacteria bacterium]
MDLSIIILTWNGEEVIAKCLDSILANSYAFNYEIIIVDNNSKDKTLEILNRYQQKHRKLIKIIKNSKNYGFAKGNNIGIKKARGKFILLLNQDIELEGNTIPRLYKDLNLETKKIKQIMAETKQKIGAVAPMLKYPSGKIQKSLRKLPTPLNIFLDALTLGRKHEQDYDHSKSQVVDQPMASCLMIKGKLLKKIKGFDENPNFFLYFNDVDLSKRIQDQNYLTFYDADCLAIHHHGESTKKLQEPARIKLWCRGLYYFLAKHYAKGSVVKKIFLFIEVKIIFIARIVLLFISKFLKIFNFNK